MIFARVAAITFIVTTSLFALDGCGSNSTSPAMLGNQGQSSGPHRAVCQPDFTLALTPESATITSGQSVRVTVQLTSICGLAGTVEVDIKSIVPQPVGSNGFTFDQSRYDVPLTANGSAGAYLTFGATPETLRTTYTITIQGEDISGCCHGLEHSATFGLTVK
jgi:hypothetical protein